MALQIADTRHEVREVVLRDKPPAMLAASPKGTVPVMVLPDGTVLQESLDIMRWALSKNDPEGWLERSDADLITANDGPFKHHLDRYKYSTRHDSDPQEHRDAAADILGTLETRLLDKPFLAGETRGLTDAAIMPFVRQFAHADMGWFDAQDWPHLCRWLAEWKASPLFTAIMVNRQQWVDPVTA